MVSQKSDICLECKKNFSDVTRFEETNLCESCFQKEESKSSYCLDCKKKFVSVKRYENSNLCEHCFEKGADIKKAIYLDTANAICPRDNTLLKKNSQGYLECETCQGKFYHSLDYNIHELYVNFPPTILGSTLLCPVCKKDMINLKHRYSRLMINQCNHCKGFWLDKDEEEAMNKVIQKQKKQKVIHQFNKKAQLNDKDLLKKYQEYEPENNKTKTGETIFQLISGLPIERNLKTFHTPYITYTLIIINIIIFLLTLFDFKTSIYNFGYIPQKQEYIKILYSMFLHGGFWHLFANMYFLWIMGDNVEDVFGPKKYLLLYILSGIISGVIGGMLGRSNVPHIGASGAIAGVMASYLLLFPKAKLLLRFYYLIVVPISSIGYLILWIVSQFLLAVRANTNISWGAHLAGFVVGAVFTLIMKKRLYKKM